MITSRYIVRIYFSEQYILEYKMTAPTCTKALKEGKKKATYANDEGDGWMGYITKAVVIRESTNKVLKTEEFSE